MDRPGIPVAFIAHRLQDMLGRNSKFHRRAVILLTTDLIHMQGLKMELYVQLYVQIFVKAYACLPILPICLPSPAPLCLLGGILLLFEFQSPVRVLP